MTRLHCKPIRIKRCKCKCNGTSKSKSLMHDFQQLSLIRFVSGSRSIWSTLVTLLFVSFCRQRWVGGVGELDAWPRRRRTHLCLARLETTLGARGRSENTKRAYWFSSASVENSLEQLLCLRGHIINCFAVESDDRRIRSINVQLEHTIRSDTGDHCNPQDADFTSFFLLDRNIIWNSRRRSGQCDATRSIHFLSLSIHFLVFYRPST